MSYLRTDIRDRIATVTFDCPESLNALSSAAIGELSEAIASLRTESGIRALLLTGNGKAFIAGANIREMRSMDARAAADFSLSGNLLMQAIETFPHPVIAAVNGFALGGGMEVALSADFIYAAQTARMGLPEVTLGIMPGFGGARRLAARVGPAAARELIFTGRMLDAAEALRIGLVNRVCEPEALLAETRATADAIAKASPAAIRAAKKHIAVCLESCRETALQAETAAFGLLFAHPDHTAGMSAFLDKTKPQWAE